MTDRISHLTVALEQDIRADDLEPLINAIKLLRGVLDVEAHITDDRLWTATSRARRELMVKMHELLDELNSDEP